MLHGANYALGYAGLLIAVELLAPPGRRASAQAALVTASFGIGNLAGQLTSGTLLATRDARGAYDWPLVFAVPFVLSLVATAVAWLGLRDPAELP
jgi:MFS family permease